MNPNFISVESLMNQDLPAEPVPGTQSTAAVQKNNGNLVTGDPSSPGYITQIVNPAGGRIFHVSISHVVEECDPYYNLINLLWSAREDDTIYIDIFTYGGQVETGCHIISGIQNTRAKVITKAYGLCCSIGAMIWAAGHVREVTENATIMFHMPSGGVFGKTADNMEESRNIQDWFTEFMTEITQGILTEEELKNIIGCRHDLFIPAATMQQRLSARNDEVSTEALGDSLIKRKHVGKVNLTDYSIEDFRNMCLPLDQKPPRQLIFTKEALADNNVLWTFFLTGTPTDKIIRDFVHKMHLPGEHDEVRIHAPSEIDLDSAEIISSAIQCCRAPVTISAPYVLNSPAAFVATSGDNIVPCKYGIMVIDLPTIASFGKVIDTDNAVRIHKTRILHLLRALQRRGFIHTEDNFLHIVKDQGSYCVYGDKLKTTIDGANAKKNDDSNV